MVWEVEYTNQFGDWWRELSEDQQDAVAARIALLSERGPHLPYPYSSDINGSRHGVMRELRAQAGGNPLRVFYAFDPTGEPQYFSSGETRPATTDSTRNMCRLPIISMTSIWKSFVRRD